MYKKMQTRKNGVEHLSAEGFYKFFNGMVFKTRVKMIFDEKLQQRIQNIEEQINHLVPLLDTNEQYDLAYAKSCDLKDVYERCSFEDAEKAFLSLKLRRNKLAHDYINGLTDTFVDIQKFYDIAVIYVISLELAIEELTNTYKITLDNNDELTLKDFANAMKEICEYNHIPYLDLHSTGMINRFNYKAFLSDGLYPNDAGHDMLANKIFSALDYFY